MDVDDLVERLVRAGGSGDVPLLRELLEVGVAVDAVDATGRTALRAAARAGLLAAVEMLLAAGADVNAVDDFGEDALHEALQFPERRPVVPSERDAFTAATGSHPGDAYDERVSIVRLLLATGSDPRRRNDHEQTPLVRASMAGSVEAAEAILVTGRAEVDAADDAELTALHYASRLGHAATVDALLAFGADVACRDSYGFTALHDAASGGHVGVVRALLLAGADPRAGLTREFEGNPVGSTPLELAKRERRRAVVDVLRAASSQVRAERDGTPHPYDTC